MSRRLVIFLLVLLIAGVIGGTVALVLNRRNQTGTSGVGALQEGSSNLPLSESGQRFEDPLGDDDQDGLINQDEVLWGTDVTNPDTDGDGTLDGQEVRTGRNPTIAGPNDTLPEGFKPQQDLNPLEVASLEPLAVDEFFSDTLDLSGGSANLTREFDQTFDTDQQSELAVDEFVLSQPIFIQLPEPTSRAINQGENDIYTLTRYLEVARGYTTMTSQERMDDVLAAVFDRDDPSLALGLMITTQRFQEDLIVQSVPPTAISLHKLLLGYSELLYASLDIMSGVQDDVIKARVAQAQIEEMRARYLPLIEQELTRLNALQAINADRANL